MSSLSQSPSSDIELKAYCITSLHSVAYRQAPYRKLLDADAIKGRSSGPNTTPNKSLEINAHLSKHAGVLLGALDTVVPLLAVLLQLANLARQQVVELVDMLLGPLDRGARHGRRKARLVDGNGVADERKVDVGDLVQVLVQVAGVGALSARCAVSTRAAENERGSRNRVRTQCGCERPRFATRGMLRWPGLQSPA